MQTSLRRCVAALHASTIATTTHATPFMSFPLSSQAPARSRGSPRSGDDDRGTLPVRHCNHHHKRHPHMVNRSPVHTLVWQSDFYATDAGRQHFAGTSGALNRSPICRALDTRSNLTAYQFAVRRSAQVHPVRLSTRAPRSILPHISPQLASHPHPLAFAGTASRRRAQHRMPSNPRPSRAPNHPPDHHTHSCADLQL